MPATSPPAATSEATADTRATRALLGAALLAVLIAALDLTVITTVLARILYDLQVNVAEIERYSWIVSGYLLAYLITIPLAGRISDLLGRRPVFLAALALFAAGSLWCMVATSLLPLIAARMVQGLGGGALVPVTLALVADLLPPARRAAAVGLVGAVDTLGWVLGPLWGAAVVGILGGVQVGPLVDWRWVFALNLPLALGVLAILARTWRLAGRIEHHDSGQFDWLGAALLTSGLTALNLALSSGGEAGVEPRALGAAPNPLAPYHWPLLGLAVLAGVLFVLWSRRAGWPLVPLALFRRAAFSGAMVTNLLVGVALIVVMVDVPFVVSLLESNVARTSLISALLLLPFTVAMAAGSLVGGMSVGRLGYRLVTIAGLLIACLGFARLFGWPPMLDYWRMGVDLAICGLGLGLVIAPIGAAAINAATTADHGIASSLVLVMRLLGMTVGLSALTSWGAGQLDQRIKALPPLTQFVNEPLTTFLQRQLAYQAQQVTEVTLTILHQTFAIAGVVCLLAILPALLLARAIAPDEQEAVTAASLAALLLVVGSAPF